MFCVFSWNCEEVSIINFQNTLDFTHFVIQVYHFKGHMKRNRKLSVLYCPCAFNSPLFRNIIIFYLNFFKRIKIALKGRNTRGGKSLQHVAATNRFVCTVKRQVTCAHCSDRLQRQIAWCERFDIRCLVN